MKFMLIKQRLWIAAIRNIGEKRCNCQNERNRFLLKWLLAVIAIPLRSIHVMQTETVTVNGIIKMTIFSFDVLNLLAL